MPPGGHDDAMSDTALPNPTNDDSPDGRLGADAAMVIVLALADDESSWKAADFAGRVADGQDTVIVVNVASGHEPIRRRVHELRDLDWLGYAALALLPPVAPVLSLGAADYDDEPEAGASPVGLPALVADEDIVVTHGDPIERICELAAQVEADLIIVGTSDPGVWSRVFSGESVSRGVVDRAQCSVLVVR